MQIRVKLIDTNTLANKDFLKWIPITLPEDSKTSDLLTALEKLYPGNECKGECGQADDDENAPSFLINGQSAGLDTGLKEGDSVTVFQVMLIGG